MSRLTPQAASFADEAALRLDFSATISASPAEVWSAFTDNRSWEQWFAGCKTCHDTSTPFGGVGSTRHIEVRGLTVDEVFITWDPEQEWAFTVVDMKRSFATAMVERARFSAVGQDRTRIDYRMAITPKRWFKPFAGIMRSASARTFSTSFANLERYLTARRADP